MSFLSRLRPDRLTRDLHAAIEQGRDPAEARRAFGARSAQAVRRVTAQISERFIATLLFDVKATDTAIRAVHIDPAFVG